MKTKTINRILIGKFKNWQKSIQDESLQKLVEGNTIITGGCIASFLLDEKVNDFDLYFRTKDVTKAVARYYVAKFNEENNAAAFNGSTRTVGQADVREENGRVKIVVKSAGVASSTQDEGYEYFEMNEDSFNQEEFIKGATAVLKASQSAKKGEYKPVFLTSNAVSLSSSVQIIIRFFGEPDAIHSNYDFIHCTNYWTSWENKVTLRKAALESLLTKELRYVGSKYPMTSVIRTRKFIRRGWTINAGQYLKMLVQLGDLDLHNVKVLEDQLVGVDVAYFLDLIDRVKNGVEQGKQVDSAYICELVDEIF